MVKDIIKDETILSQKCDKVTTEEAELVQDITDTLTSLEDAACLAANQIGVTKAVGVYADEDDNLHVIYNPTLRKALYPMKTVEECFSHDGDVKVTRYGWIEVALDEPENGKLVPKKRTFEGRDAQIVQHIIDHCKGKLV